MPFKKGQSGNPGGRPKVESEVLELAKKNSAMAIRRLIDWAQSDDHKASIPACNAILDRAIGKPKQALEHSGPDGDRLVVQIVKFADTCPER